MIFLVIHFTVFFPLLKNNYILIRLHIYVPILLYELINCSCGRTVNGKTNSHIRSSTHQCKTKSYLFILNAKENVSTFDFHWTG
jgi:hypothetical protein